MTQPLALLRQQLFTAVLSDCLDAAERARIVLEAIGKHEKSFSPQAQQLWFGLRMVPSNAPAGQYVDRIRALLTADMSVAVTLAPGAAKDKKYGTTKLGTDRTQFDKPRVLLRLQRKRR